MPRNETPSMVYAGEFLWQTLRQAKTDASNLVRANLGGTRDSIIEDIVNPYTYSPLILKPHQIRIAENRPCELVVSWPISGSVNLIGMIDPQREFISSTLLDGKITEKWIYPKPIRYDTSILSQIKNNLSRKLEYFQKHLDNLNKLIDSYNQELKKTIEKVVDKRLDELAQIEKIEKYLNGPL